ncbi:PDZ domain protein [Candidatus Methanoperedenaceae archaeon GB50]|nr:PDZ domain protein [Candidatus Methanoperedenaceae archaeon GB50]
MAEEQGVVPSGYDLGIEVTEITPSIAARLGIDKGVVISRVRPGSLAYEAGLRRGDVILEINKKPIIKLDDYYQAIKRLKPGESVLFLVKRQEGTLFIPLQIPKGE